MLIYNNQINSNPFGFNDINKQSVGVKSIQPRDIKRVTSRKSCAKKKKLSKKNIVFLKSLGFTVKKH